MPLEIKEMYAFIAEDEEGEGLAAFLRDDIWMPLVGADAARVDNLRIFAQTVADQSGRRITLARFTVRTDLEVIEPKGRS